MGGLKILRMNKVALRPSSEDKADSPLSPVHACVPL